MASAQIHYIVRILRWNLRFRRLLFPWSSRWPRNPNKMVCKFITGIGKFTILNRYWSRLERHPRARIPACKSDWAIVVRTCPVKTFLKRSSQRKPKNRICDMLRLKKKRLGVREIRWPHPGKGSPHWDRPQTVDATVWLENFGWTSS